MILKIKNRSTPGAWIICSGIREISYERILQSKLKVPCDRYFDYGETYEKGSDPTWLQIMVTFKDGHGEVWRADASLYLLNDEGKTIERLW